MLPLGNNTYWLTSHCVINRYTPYCFDLSCPEDSNIRRPHLEILNNDFFGLNLLKHCIDGRNKLELTGCVTRMLEGGAPLSLVASILGWSSATIVRMAKRYGHIGQVAQDRRSKYWTSKSKRRRVIRRGPDLPEGGTKRGTANLPTRKLQL